MPTWLPVAKAILPYLGDIISAAKPAFTRRKDGSESNQIELLQQQVTELQNASLQNIHFAQALAEQLQTAINGLEQRLSTTHAKLRRMTWLAAIALALACMAVGLAAIAFHSN